MCRIWITLETALFTLLAFSDPFYICQIICRTRHGQVNLQYSSNDLHLCYGNYTFFCRKMSRLIGLLAKIQRPTTTAKVFAVGIWCNWVMVNMTGLFYCVSCLYTNITSQYPFCMPSGPNFLLIILKSVEVIFEILCQIVMDDHQRSDGIPVTRFTLHSIYAQSDTEKLEFEYESGNMNFLVSLISSIFFSFSFSLLKKVFSVLKKISSVDSVYSILLSTFSMDLVSRLLTYGLFHW